MLGWLKKLFTPQKERMCDNPLFREYLIEFAQELEKAAAEAEDPDYRKKIRELNYHVPNDDWLD